MPTATAGYPEAPADDPVIRIARQVAAPRDLVWSAWTDPSRVTHWWGPRGFRTTTHSHDLRPGGTWSFTMHGPDGTDYPNRVVFDAVEPPARLTYAHYGPEDPEDAPHFHARVTFAEAGARTLITLTMRCATLAARDRLVAFGAVEGGRDTLARFAALVEG